MRRKLFSLMMTVLMLGVLGTAGQGAGGKAAPWQPFIPAHAYKELTGRSIKSIEEIAKSSDKHAAEKIATEAAILVGYTLSVPNPSDDTVASLRGAALAARKLDLKKLTDFAKTISTSPKAPADVKDWKPTLPEIGDLMELFRGKAKRGEGIHVDLQFHPKLKNLNGIEALIGTLGAKKISDDNLAKISRELPNLAYRIAVIGSLTYESAPAKDKAKWQELSLQMRDASIALAKAAQQKNGDDVLQAAQKLENSCTNCHRDFKKN